MKIQEIKAKSILRTYKRIDSWFISCYGMNLYQGCKHNCVYCDGRSEKYQIHNNFGEEIVVKTNAIEVLEKEIQILIRKQQKKHCFFMLGGGVGDSYQPIEETYRLTRKALKLFRDYQLPVTLLTKSTLIKRDIDILKDINKKTRVLINFSFSSTNDEISKIFEPGVPPPSERLETLKYFKKQGFSCGMFLLPIIPFITDKNEIIKKTIQDAYHAKLDYVIFGGMTLKTGRQKEYFLAKLQKYNPSLLSDYNIIYKRDKWGQPTLKYSASINEMLDLLMKQYHIAKRIPALLYHDVLNENDLVSVILDQIDYLLKLKGKKSPYGFASYQIAQLQKPLSSMKQELQTIKGVGSFIEKIIKEILETKTSSYYEQLLYN